MSRLEQKGSFYSTMKNDQTDQNDTACNCPMDYVVANFGASKLSLLGCKLEARSSSAHATAYFGNCSYSGQLQEINTHHNLDINMASSLHSFPNDIAAWRQRLFAVEEEVVLSAADFTSIWPYVDNIWSVQQSSRSKSNCFTRWFLCRLHRAKDHQSATEEHRGKRAKSAHTAIGCGMRISVAERPDGSVLIKRAGKCTAEHLHTLEYSDRYKRNSALHGLAAEQVALGYKVAQIYRNLAAMDRPAARQQLHDAGGKFLTLKDVHNAAQAATVNAPDI